jgi:GT2 family glycosyltransferase
MTPPIAVVIPTLGRSQALPEVLERLRQQDGVRPFEILVVADAAAPAVEEETHRAQRPGASAARNVGLRETGTELVLFLGDDILPSPRLVATHLAWHARLPDERVAVLGHVRWARRLRRTAFMAWLERGIQTDYRSIDGDRAGWGHFYTTNVSVKRAFALGAGGFDEDLPFLYEDLDLGRRLHDRGLDLRYARDAEAEHLHPPTLEDWRRRMEAVGRAERAFAEKHPDFEPYFLRRLGGAAEGAPARGRGARLAAWVGEDVPWLGPRVWASAEAYFAQQLWPAFERGYDGGRR